MELDSHSELDNPLLYVPTAGCPDSCLLLLFRSAIERTNCGVHKPLRTDGLPTTLTSIVLVVADGFFGLCVSERLGRATHRYRTPHPHPPNRSYVVCEDVKPYISAPHPTPPHTLITDRMWSLGTLNPTISSFQGIFTPSLISIGSAGQADDR